MSWQARFLALAAVLVVGVAAWPRAGRAEKVKTNQSTKLYSRAGEQAPVVLKVKSGQAMTVLAKDGRWIKVRVSGRTGWVPRSKVDLPEGDDELVRNTRRRPFVDGRGTKRGFGGEGGPDDRIGADATGDGEEPRAKPERGDDAPARRTRPPADSDDDDEVISVDDDDASAGSGEGEEEARPTAHVAKSTVITYKPDKNSEESFTADPSMALYVGRTQGNWTRVSNEDGDAGYVLTSKLALEDAGRGGAHKRELDLRGRIGFTFVRQSVSTPSGQGALPDNYTASSPSITIALGGSALYPYKKRYMVGGELAYDYNRTVFGGITYSNVTNGFAYHVLNLRAVGGYDLRKQNGMMVYARVGLHYDSFQVANVADLTKNTAKIPSQIITAPTLGGALGIPRLTPKLGLLLSVDVIPLLGSVKQTKNLEDGTDPSARALFLGGRLTYKWKRKMDLQLTYDLSYTSISFGGPAPATSMRGHVGTGKSSGSDFNNAIAGGVTYAF